MATSVRRPTITRYAANNCGNTPVAGLEADNLSLPANLAPGLEL